MKGAQSIQETVRLKRMQKSAFVFNIIKAQNKELKIVHIAFCPPILSCSNLSIFWVLLMRTIIRLCMLWYAINYRHFHPDMATLRKKMT